MARSAAAAVEGPPATVPPEARGLARDDVRLLVADRRGVRHSRFYDLARWLAPGDLVVVNTSATLRAAVNGTRVNSHEVVVHFSTALDDGRWAVEVRPRERATGPVTDLEAGERITLAGHASLTLCTPYPVATDRRTRLWTCEVSARGGVGAVLRRSGRPIAYGYTKGNWPLRSYQTIFAAEPGSAEMPSAGRPFSRRVIASLAQRGIGVARLTLHTGVSTPEVGEAPFPERYDVPAETAALVNRTRQARGRVVAVGTTVTRALESVAERDATVHVGAGWTDLELGPRRPARVVTGLVTGWHSAGASHLRLLAAVAGSDVVERAYAAAVKEGYLWHEFGDSALLLSERY